MTHRIKISDSDVSRLSAALHAITDRGIKKEAFRQAQDGLLTRYQECIIHPDYDEERSIQAGVTEALRIIDIIRVKNYF